MDLKALEESSERVIEDCRKLQARVKELEHHETNSHHHLGRANDLEERLQEHQRHLESSRAREAALKEEMLGTEEAVRRHHMSRKAGPWDSELRRLELRLAAVEQQLAEIQLQKNGDFDFDSQDSSLSHEDSAFFGDALYTRSGDEIRGGVATCGPCYEISQSIWDACLMIGLPVLSGWDSVLVALLVVVNICTQLGFVYIVALYMTEDILQNDELKELLRFRAIVAHDVKYADLASGRSLATQICMNDGELHIATTQRILVDDLRSYRHIGPCLALLAIACWLATTLKEFFALLSFCGSMLHYPSGKHTLLQKNADGKIMFAQISQLRRLALLLCVALPRAVVAVSLAITGTMYLAHTVSLEDLIMNAVALAFIMDLDQLIEEAFAPRRARYLLNEISYLPIPRLPCAHSKPIPVGQRTLRIPGIGRITAGSQERMKNLVKAALLVTGLVLVYQKELAPLQSRIQLALNILCSGETSFVYAVNPATGLVEATRTYTAEEFEDQSVPSVQAERLQEVRSAVLSLARPALNDFDIETAVSPPLLRLDWPHRISGIYYIDKTSTNDVENQVLMLPCQNAAFQQPFREALLKLTGDQDSCAALWRDERCSWRNMTSLRALCPESCGCNDALEPAAGAFATPIWGCPAVCKYQRDVSQELRGAPCQDWALSRFVGDAYFHRFMRGIFSFSLESPDMRRAEVSLYVKELNHTFRQLLPGEKDSFLEVAEHHFRSGAWVEDLLNGQWNLAPGVPHPRGLKGCEFLGSWELQLLSGINFCRRDEGAEPLRTFRPQCPVVCKCKADHSDCPSTCPE
ncbi:unnamed protein product [Effrenium voratum]|nr:unnamed protein product [Effrenium voratum]